MIGGKLKHFIYDAQDARNYWRSLNMTAKQKVRDVYKFNRGKSRDEDINWPVVAWLMHNGVLVP